MDLKSRRKRKQEALLLPPPFRIYLCSVREIVEKETHPLIYSLLESDKSMNGRKEMLLFRDEAEI